MEGKETGGKTVNIRWLGCFRKDLDRSVSFPVRGPLASSVCLLIVLLFTVFRMIFLSNYISSVPNIVFLFFSDIKNNPYN